MSFRLSIDERVAEVVMDFPPVNALPIAAWHELAEMLRRLGSDPAVSVVILAAEGRGWCAGPDMKELAAGGDQALIDVNRACYDAFAAVYECAVPVIAVIHGYCLGGGVGLAGNADIVVASSDASFGLPEVDRGALGAATHLGRLVPPKRVREMLYTGDQASAAELLGYGSIHTVVPREQLAIAAKDLARKIAAKHPTVIRKAKESLNAIDAVDPRKSYRVEQGFTFELGLSPDAAEARRAFVEKRPPRYRDVS
jgi:enoyl-CoA hydratase